ncbi:SH3 domain-containing protein [Maribacter sp. MAR_2009_72]|uniref:SH3 domain-containing protein n=1 Tax=Maribacter sp. MAR_2009_72 TaxID=1250050 RepID=UPI00119A059E|nr:SH3 domain-containing protein [Maribacter sp. MAR_2009_72]TVZ14775.1 SH3 domain-containing protein [Maribacter sp. MAR_2009_72]
MRNVKKSALFLSLFAMVNLFAQTEQVEFEIMDQEIPVEELNYEYLLAHKVFLREKPSVRSKKVGLLDIGTKMVLWEKSLYSKEIDGVNSHWYRVTTENQTGWVWGGMIAQKSFGSIADNQVKFVYGYESSTQNEAGLTKVNYQLRAFKNGQQLDKIVFDSLHAIPVHIENHGSLGLFNVEDVITVDLADAESGYQVGKSYVFWNNGRFIKVADLVDYADNNYLKTEHFVFPSDMQGVKSTILLKTTITKNIKSLDDALAQDNVEFITTPYSWNGSKLVKKQETRDIKDNAVVSIDF